MERTIFISHSCQDHAIVNELSTGLQYDSWKILVDPFAPGDRTCTKVQEMIKLSSHFILLNTVNSVQSRWVYLESLFSKICYDHDAICFIPINVDNVEPRSETKDLISINWNTSRSISDLIVQLRESINNTTPQKPPLPLNKVESERIKENGREFERTHFRTGNWEYNLRAIDAYDEAIVLDFCNHNAWANQAWCLWKQREDNRAYKSISIAEELSPTSNHVKDVKMRIQSGKRSFG